jgi:hypothetical protein
MSSTSGSSSTRWNERLVEGIDGLAWPTPSSATLVYLAVVLSVAMYCDGRSRRSVSTFEEFALDGG